MDAEATGAHGRVPVFWVYDKNQFTTYNAAFQDNANSVGLDLREHPCDTAEEVADAVRNIRDTVTGPYTMVVGCHGDFDDDTWYFTDDYGGWAPFPARGRTSPALLILSTCYGAEEHLQKGFWNTVLHPGTQVIGVKKELRPGPRGQAWSELYENMVPNLTQRPTDGQWLLEQAKKRYQYGKGPTRVDKRWELFETQ